MNELLAYLEELKRIRETRREQIDFLGNQHYNYKIMLVELDRLNIKIQEIEKCLELLFKGWKVGDECWIVFQRTNMDGVTWHWDITNAVVDGFKMRCNGVEIIYDDFDESYPFNLVFRTEAEAITELERRTKND